MCAEQQPVVVDSPKVKRKQDKEETALATRSMTPGQLATALLNRGDFTVDDLAKLSDLELKREANEERKAFAQALVMFQQKVKPIIMTGHRDDRKVKKKDNTFGTVHYDYAEISTTIEQIRPLLQECGLVPTWQSTPKSGPSYIEIECKLTHIMGHSETSLPLGAPPLDGGGLNAVQQRTGTVTMLKRTTLFMVLGLVTKEDDKDIKNGEQGKPETKPPSKQAVEDPERQAKETFRAVCQRKTGETLPNGVLHALLSKAQAACGSESVADCVKYIDDDAIVLGKDGSMAVVTGTGDSIDL